MAIEGPSRRTFLQMLVAAGTGAAVSACAPLTQPATSPVAPISPAASAKPAWEAQWDQWVAAAGKEGALNLATLSGAGYTKAIAAFTARYPDIKVEHQAFNSSSLLIPRVQRERDGGIYGWDVAQTSQTSLMAVLKPLGTFEPLRPILIRPDVQDDKLWLGGLDELFSDKDKQSVITFNVSVIRLYVNTDLVKDGEIKSVKDLLDPKWKGKLLWADVRQGQTFTPFYSIRENLGDTVVKQLLIDQQPTFMRDVRQITEAMVRGQFPVSTGVNPTYLDEFRAQGLGKNVKPLELPEVRVTSSGGGLFLFNRAPHPNAAKVFINWLLTKEGQTAWCEANQWNSRRLDVPPFDKETAPTPGVKYLVPQNEERMGAQEDTRKFLEQLVQN